ncbi:MAG: peptidoglycan DD-metalloendopeptidase family protein [Chitinophagales bacterium]|nr:peptidoglycan DD-metalloendopeptidase family protein [Chitinophagales bacterium]MDW8274294.1 peptidoglycan DD-metalloendopeptidase family protein [Chitinophagales bacterium]
MKTTVETKWKNCNSLGIISWVLIFLVLVCGIVHAQNANTQKRKEALQEQMIRLQKEIKEIESFIEITSKKKKQSLSELQSLNAKIKSREKLIQNLQSQLKELESNIIATSEDLQQQINKVEKMKKDYAMMLRHTYQNYSKNNLLYFMLATNSFYEALNRYRWTKKIAELRREQTKQLQYEIKLLEQKKSQLEEEKNEQLQVIKEENKQQNILLHEKREQAGMLAKLTDQEKKLRRQFEQKQAAIRTLNRKIEAIIAEEIRLARIKANEGGPALPTTPKKEADVIPLAPDEKALSNDFAGNKGKLPWPVIRGHITSGFGRQEHPSLKGVYIENNGIDIKTTGGSEARAIFEGVVVSVFSLPTTNTCVIIKHGEYFTVYSNLEQVNVKTGQRVTAKQTIGKLASEPDENFTKIHLEIWRGKEKLDPELWLASR